MREAMESDDVGAHLWNARALRMIEAGQMKWTSRDLFTGPRNIRDAYASEDLIRWQNAAPDRHVTWAQAQEWWMQDNGKSDARAREAYEAQAIDAPLMELSLLRDMMSKRDGYIKAARDMGESWATICEASGLTRAAAYEAYKRAGGTATNRRAG
jgi:hypothetical protein